MSDAWPFAAMALLGAYHGINPAMGWMFAVGLGLQDGNRRSVLRALGPIAIGHEAAIALVAGLVIVLGVLADPAPLHVGAAICLVGFGVFRFVRPHARPRWTPSMRVKRSELTWWSFLMSSAHGAGLMVAPVLLAGASLEAGTGHDVAHGGITGGLSMPGTALALALHVGGMLLTMGVVSLLVYDHFGTRLLRRRRLSLDRLWAAAFVGAGALTLVS